MTTQQSWSVRGAAVLEQPREGPEAFLGGLFQPCTQNSFSSQQNLEIHRKIKQSEQELAYLERRERQVSSGDPFRLPLLPGRGFQAAVGTEDEEALKDAVRISQNSSNYIKMGAFYNL